MCMHKSIHAMQNSNARKFLMSTPYIHKHMHFRDVKYVQITHLRLQSTGGKSLFVIGKFLIM